MISAFSQCQANSLTMKMKIFLDASSSRSTDNYLRSISDVFISVMWPRSMYLLLYIGHSHFFQIHDEQEDSHVTLQPQTAPKRDPNHSQEHILLACKCMHVSDQPRMSFAGGMQLYIVMQLDVCMAVHKPSQVHCSLAR
jgi:hypothetical protein